MNNALALYENIQKQLDKLEKDFDKLYPKKSPIVLKKDGVIITIDYKGFKPKK